MLWFPLACMLNGISRYPVLVRSWPSVHCSMLGASHSVRWKIVRHAHASSHTMKYFAEPAALFHLILDSSNTSTPLSLSLSLSLSLAFLLHLSLSFFLSFVLSVSFLSVFLSLSFPYCSSLSGLFSLSLLYSFFSVVTHFWLSYSIFLSVSFLSVFLSISLFRLLSLAFFSFL